jgi:hypothetical protein
MTTRRIRTACYCAYLHDPTRQGLLVLPQYAHDVEVERGSASLMAADEAAMLSRLQEEGYALSLDEYGQPWATVGLTRGGREAVALYSAEPVTELPTLVEMRAGQAALRLAARLLREPSPTPAPPVLPQLGPQLND